MPLLPTRGSFYNGYSLSGSKTSTTPETVKPPPSYHDQPREKSGRSGSGPFSSPRERRKSSQSTHQTSLKQKPRPDTLVKKPVSRTSQQGGSHGKHTHKDTPLPTVPRGLRTSQYMHSSGSGGYDPTKLTHGGSVLSRNFEHKSHTPTQNKQSQSRERSHSQCDTKPTEPTHGGSASSRNLEHESHTPKQNRQSRSKERPQSPRLKRSHSVHEASSTRYSEKSSLDPALSVGGLAGKSQISTAQSLCCSSQSSLSGGTLTRSYSDLSLNTPKKQLEGPENQSVEQTRSHSSSSQTIAVSKMTKQNHTTLPSTDITSPPSSKYSPTTTSSMSPPGPGTGPGTRANHSPPPITQRASLQSPESPRISVRETSYNYQAATCKKGKVYRVAVFIAWFSSFSSRVSRLWWSGGNI